MAFSFESIRPLLLGIGGPDYVAMYQQKLQAQQGFEEQRKKDAWQLINLYVKTGNIEAADVLGRSYFPDWQDLKRQEQIKVSEIPAKTQPVRYGGDIGPTRATIEPGQEITMPMGEYAEILAKEKVKAEYTTTDYMRKTKTLTKAAQGDPIAKFIADRLWPEQSQQAVRVGTNPTYYTPQSWESYLKTGNVTDLVIDRNYINRLKDQSKRITGRTRIWEEWFNLLQKDLKEGRITPEQYRAKLDAIAVEPLRALFSFIMRDVELGSTSDIPEDAALMEVETKHPAAENKGRIIRDTQTNIRYRSDGMKWIRVKE